MMQTYQWAQENLNQFSPAGRIVIRNILDNFFCQSLPLYELIGMNPCNVLYSRIARWSCTIDCQVSRLTFGKVSKPGIAIEMPLAYNSKLSDAIDGDNQDLLLPF